MKDFVHGRFFSRRISFEWHLWSFSLGAGIGTCEEGLKFNFQFPPVSFYWTFSVPRSWVEFSPFRTFEWYAFEVRVFAWAVWWQIWCGSESRKSWRRNNFDLADFFLGHTSYTCEELEKREVQIPMPEGPYKGLATKERCTWKRPRWFAKTRLYVSLDIPDGIPSEGKGESEYNCGEDALFGLAEEGPRYEDVIAKAVKSVLRDRSRYNGNINAVYPHPAVRAVRLAKLRSEAQRDQATHLNQAQS